MLTKEGLQVLDTVFFDTTVESDEEESENEERQNSFRDLLTAKL